jgi:hypothetical protein
MPQIITRPIPIINPTAAQTRHHRQRSQSPANCNVNVAGVSAHPRYGSLGHKTSNASGDRRQHVTKLGTIPATQDSDEEEAIERHPVLKVQPREDDSVSSSSSSSYTRFSDLTRREVRFWSNF